ncbi:MAG: Trk system potassium transporter TrkA [Spirochaetales bacterium]|nr:Trk system potassium transporter TrkA [Spirochaetales bacterium]
MRIVVVGGGIIGTQVARRLVEKGQDVVLVERDPIKARHLSNDLDCRVICGEGTDLDALIEAGVAEADLLAALTGSDEVNIVSCLVAGRESPALRTIARVKNPDYARLGGASGSPFPGIDRVVYPEVAAAHELVAAIGRGSTADQTDLPAWGLRLRAIDIASGSGLEGVPLKDLRNTRKGDFLVLAIRRGEELIVPRGEERLLPDDRAFVIGSPAGLDAALGAPPLPLGRNRTVAVIGGGLVGEEVLRGFFGDGKAPRGKAAVFEQSIEKCKDIAERFPEVLVVHRDMAEEEAFADERIGAYDLVVAATGNQDFNLLSAARAKALGAKRCAALLVSGEYPEILERLEVDVAVSLRDAVTATVIAATRAGSLRTLRAFLGEGLELVEAEIRPDAPLAYKSLKDARLPEGALVAFVGRAGKTLPATGDTRLQPGDRVGILVRTDVAQNVENLV